MSASRTACNVRFCAAVEGKTDIAKDLMRASATRTTKDGDAPALFLLLLFHVTFKAPGGDTKDDDHGRSSEVPLGTPAGLSDAFSGLKRG